MLKRVLVLLLLPLISLGCRADNLNLKIRYDQVHGLQKGDQVIFEQHPIGIVTGVSYRNNGDYLVSVVIKKGSNAVVTEHTRFFIADDPVRQGHKAVEVVQIRPGGSLLKNQATVEGSTRASVFFDQMKSGFGNLKKEFEQFSQELSKVLESEAFKKLENELKDLAGEIEQAGKAAREEIEQQWLPRFKQELEKLKERLRKLGREDELKQLEIELERIKTSL